MSKFYEDFVNKYKQSTTEFPALITGQEDNFYSDFLQPTRRQITRELSEDMKFSQSPEQLMSILPKRESFFNILKENVKEGTEGALAITSKGLRWGFDQINRYEQWGKKNELEIVNEFRKDSGKSPYTTIEEMDDDKILMKV